MQLTVIRLHNNSLSGLGIEVCELGRLISLWEIDTISKRSADVGLVWPSTLFCTVCGSEVEAPWSSRPFWPIVRPLSSLKCEENQTFQIYLKVISKSYSPPCCKKNLYDFWFVNESYRQDLWTELTDSLKRLDSKESVFFCECSIQKLLVSVKIMVL